MSRSWTLLGVAFLFAATLWVASFVAPERINPAPSLTVGTVGNTGEPSPRGSGAGPAAIVPPVLIQDLRLADVGASDLIGRRLSTRVPLGVYINDVAFWTGSSDDDRMLVVLSRDMRTEAQRQAGLPATSGIATFSAGDVIVTGTVRHLPNAEAMYSWGLTNLDADWLSERPMYLAADTAMAAR
jgi:hypothetical protein